MKNVGTMDRVIRLILGLILLSGLFYLNGAQRYLGLIGLIPIITAVAGFCPLYRLFGIRTCPVKKS